MGTPVVIGIDGSVFKCYTNFKARIEACLSEIFADDARYSVHLFYWYKSTNTDT